MAIAASSVLRADSPSLGAFSRQLEHLEARVIEKKYPAYKAAEGKLFQIEELNLPWVQNTTFRMVDGVGDFELADDQTTNLPYVDAVSEEFTQRTFQYRSGYYYTEKEVAAAAYLNMPIDAQKISLVRQAYMQTLNKLLLFGDRRSGVAGFVNHPAWLRSVAPYRLDGSVSSIPNMLATLNAGASGIINATEDVVEPDTLLLPRQQYDYLLSQPRIENTDKTVLRYFLENNPSITNIDYLRELNGTGPNGEDLAIFYKRDPECFKARITDPFRFRDLVLEPFRVYRPVAFDWNGFMVYVAGAVNVMVGV